MILKMEKPTFWKKYYRNCNNLRVLSNNLRVDWILYFKKLEWYTNNLLEFLFLLNFSSWVKLRRNKSIFGLQNPSSFKMADSQRYWQMEPLQMGWYRKSDVITNSKKNFWIKSTKIPKCWHYGETHLFSMKLYKIYLNE